ncbi:MAG: hypothetical protein J5822_09550 [Eubacteriaceae bacterium]|nr:hypothetical protein [Eubacteriaceae bacterium]
MKGILKAMIICIVLALAVLLTLWGVRVIRERRRIASYEPYDGIIGSVSYSSGGGMDGGSTRISAENTDGGYVLITVERRSSPKGREEKKTFKADPQVFRDLEEMVSGCGMKDWGELPVSEFIALDAPVKSVTIDFTDGTWKTIRSTDQLPDGCEGLIADIRQILEKYTEN